MVFTLEGIIFYWEKVVRAHAHSSLVKGIINQIYEDLEKIHTGTYEFIDKETGLECKVVLNEILGLKGAVKIPEELKDIEDSKLYELEVYNDVIDIFPSLSEEGTVTSKWVTFVCNGINDITPFICLSADTLITTNPNSAYRNIDFVKAECAKLAKQLKELAEKKEKNGD